MPQYVLQIKNKKKKTKENEKEIEECVTQKKTLQSFRVKLSQFN